MICHIVFIILVIFIIYQKIYNKTIEGFASGKTDIVYSNRVIDDSSDKYANINEEILVLNQDAGMDRVSNFKYFRGPFYSYMALYSRMLNPKGELATINTTLVQITEQNYDIMQLLGTNRVLVNDNFNNIKYYIKVLDKESYADEVKKARIHQIKLNNYTQCVNLQKLTSPFNIAMANCKSQFQQI
jgi:hypothetical protein